MGKRLRHNRDQVAGIIAAAIASVAATLFILSLRLSGTLEWLELVTYDWMVQRRSELSELSPDSRLLIIGITEADLQDRGGLLQLPDQVYATLLETVLQARPRAVGLDIYRDKPVEPGHQRLMQIFQRSDRVIGITKIGDGGQPTIAPPPSLSPEQVGFNDALVDRDGIIRRSLLFLPDDRGDQIPSFALQLAGRYWKDEGIEPKPSSHDPDAMELEGTTVTRLQPHDGGYVHADTRSYQILLNYRGDERSMPIVSLGAVMAGRVAPETLRDRIILIGNVAESAKDFFNTPFSAGLTERRMPGVMIHAQMVSQLLDIAAGQRQLFWFWSDWAEGVWILVWSGLGGLVAARSRKPLFLLMATPLSLAGLLGACFISFMQDGWIPLVPPALGFVITTGSVVAYTSQQAQRQQQMVMRLFGQSTSPEIADTLWQRRDELLQNGRLPGQKLTSTLLFTDLKGFSTIAEQYAPEQLLTWLNAYLDVMAQLVQQHQGVINKFTGDGIMAVFGVPIAHESLAEIQQDARNAVDCAIAMDQALTTLNAAWQAQGLPQVQMRVGIYTGSVVVGSLGSRVRLEYGVIGDAVNIASRLESLDKDRQPSPCRILIAEPTRDCLTDRYELESWGAMSLKGKATQVNVYRVAGYR
ncbi:MAG: adenylate/guanylate cyclase domain-containing protein [Thermosynechococcaceae cyanobacterium]